MTDSRAFEDRYVGELSRRNPTLALILALLCPGAGWAYVGRLGVGLLANVASVALWGGFVFVWATRKFYPVAPLKAFALGWCVLVTMAAADAWRTARSTDESYVLRDSNHPLVYAAVALFTFFLPLLGLHHVATRSVWTVQPVVSDAMAPTLVPGDRVLVDRRAYTHRPIAPGDVVLYALDHDTPRFGRVVALPGDDLVATWDILFRNDVPAPRTRLSEEDEAALVALSGELDRDVVPYVETLDGASYPIVAPRRSFSAQPINWQPGSGEYVILNDNRVNDEDSRRLGLVREDQIIGRPTFVGFSTTEPIAPIPFALRALTLSEHDERFRTERHGRRVQPHPARRRRG